jgi:dTDP-4-amino-4,6-dideoxygalactose transaminase
VTTDTLISAAAEVPGLETGWEGNVPQFPGVIGTFMGRDALSLAISYLDLGENDVVVLPVYTCQDVIKQFVRKCQVRFYDVRPDLTIDPDELRAVFEGSAPIKMLLITNYFGFLQPYRTEIKKLTEANGICLVEDCAHSLLTEGSGETGDLSTYSFRKILPLRDGGGLVVNAKSKLALPKYHHRLYSDTLSFLAFAKSLLNVRTERFSRARVASQTAQALPFPSKNSRILPLSRFARHSIRDISLSEVVKKRRVDFSYWQGITSNNPALTPMFNDLPSGVCPLGFALRAKNRESLEWRAQEMGIHLRVHWRLDANLGSQCSTSHELSKDILTLPIYPELGSRERDVLTGIMQQA